MRKLGDVCVSVDWRVHSCHLVPGTCRQLPQSCLLVLVGLQGQLRVSWKSQACIQTSVTVQFWGGPAPSRGAGKGWQLLAG